MAIAGSGDRIAKLCKTFFDLYSFSDVKSDRGRWNDSKSILSEIAADFLNIARVVGSPELRESHSVGVGVPAKIPWIAIMDKTITTSAKSGYYCTLLFDPFSRKVYFTLMVGVTAAQSRDTSRTKDESILASSGRLKDAAIGIGLNGVDLRNGPIQESQWNSGLQKSYALGTSLYRVLDTKSESFSEDAVRTISSIASIYKSLADSGFMPSSDVTATASLPPKKAIIEQKPTIKSDLASFLREWKYHYETEIIENILLSLKIKKLVILTGNSGSGKTRLARILSEYCSVPILERKRMDIDVRVGKSPENQGWALNRSQVYQQFPELESYTQTYDIEIDGVQGRGKFELTPRLFFENNDDLVRKLSEMRERDPNSRTTLSVMMPSERNGRIEIVAVGANWTDNRHLFGFYNPVTQKYIKTPALDLLLSSNAINMVQSAHFLILDEMNLSHVERYFSDFLSAMEIENGKVNLHSDDESCGIPRSISIRKNLFVFGTVNVDETTYMFSPKVLDRANVVEMPIIPPEEYLLGSLETKEFSGDVEFLSDPLDDSGYGHGGIEQVKSAFSRISGGESGNLWETISRELQNIQDALEGSSFEMGIRTLNEIIGFMYVAWRYERSPGDFKNWKRYLDAQINQKILPKIHGSNKEISDLLKSLYQACLKQEFQDKVASYLVAEGTEIEAISRFPRSAKKISSMYDIVQSAKYVSYTR